MRVVLISRTVINCCGKLHIEVTCFGWKGSSLVLQVFLVKEKTLVSSSTGYVVRGSLITDPDWTYYNQLTNQSRLPLFEPFIIRTLLHLSQALYSHFASGCWYWSLMLPITWFNSFAALFTSKKLNHKV